MFLNHRYPKALAGFALVVGLTTLSNSASAQAALDPRPVSRPGGFAGQEMNQIYQSDVGIGFTSTSLNQLALQNARAQVPSFGQDTVRRSSPSDLGLGQITGGAKPFSAFSPDPTVSPYLNLFREDFEGGGDFNYNTLVRPQLQQQQVNQQVQRQNMEMARRIQSIAAQGAFNPQGSQSQYPTGHPTVFMNYGRYYPNPGGRGRR